MGRWLCILLPLSSLAFTQVPSPLGAKPRPVFHAAPANTIVLPLGESRTINVGAASSVHVGSKALLAVFDRGSTLSLVGKKIGETHLLVGARSYRVQIVDPGAAAFHRRLLNWLKDRKGLRLEFEKGRLRFSGRLYKFSDWEEIADLARETGGTYEFAARPLPDVADKALRRFTEVAASNGLPQPRLVTEGGLAISLPAGADDYVPIAEKAFSPFGIAVRINPSQVKLQPLVRTQVILAELNRESSRTFGIQWPDGYQAQLLPQLRGPPDLTVKLNTLETQGLGKVLASPNLLCRSGSTADFLAGGEIPIRASRFFGGGQVSWKQHGVVLRLQPVADASGAMSIDIETEVSLLDKANSIEGIPALRTNRVHSHFDLLGRKTIALSGLLRSDWGIHREGLAGLASLPVLGALFRSQSFQERKSELVVFVTPEVVRPEFDGDAVRMPEGWADDEL